jgi:hypothetical protein
MPSSAGGAAGAGAGAVVSAGGMVADPMSGFSISIVPPHFAQRVFALARSPSLASSKRYRDWQAGQTTIIAALLRPARGGAAAVGKTRRG